MDKKTERKLAFDKELDKFLKKAHEDYSMEVRSDAGQFNKERSKPLSELSIERRLELLEERGKKNTGTICMILTKILK